MYVYIVKMLSKIYFSSLYELKSNQDITLVYVHDDENKYWEFKDKELVISVTYYEFSILRDFADSIKFSKHEFNRYTFTLQKESNDEIIFDLSIAVNNYKHTASV